MIKTFHLPNGVTCVSEERPGTKKVAMRVDIKSGSMHEDMQENGLTFLTQESCLGGTKTRSREQIAEHIESKGGTLSTVTTRDATSFWVQSLSRDVEDVFAVLSDVLRNPAFDPAEIQKTKAQIEQWIDRESQEVTKKTGNLFHETVFAGQAIGNNPMGTKQLLASFTPGQVKQKHAELLEHPENIVISFAGDIDSAMAEKLANDYFGDLQAATTTPAMPQVKFESGDTREANNNDQLNIMFGFEAPSAHDPEKYSFTMLQELISGGMSSPLFREVREKRGLVYSVHAYYAPLETTGMFYISAGAGKGNAGELISTTINNVLGDVLRKGFSDEELAKARERILRHTKASLESAKNASSRNAGQILTYGRTVSFEELEEDLKQVTPEAIQKACADLLRDGKYALTGVGPQDTMPSEQDIEAMMQKQLQGVTIPKPKPATLIKTLAVSFASSVQNLTKRLGAPFASAVQNDVTAPQGNTDPQMTVLPNGIKIVTAEREGSLSCGAWVGTGADNETLKENGASHMLEHMMFKGTPSYGPGEIEKIIEEQLGGALNAYTGKDQTAYYFYNLMAGDIEKIVDICGEMVFKADLAHEEFDGKTTTNADGTTKKNKGERDVVIEELKRANDNIGSKLWNLVNETAYPNQPHGREILGTEFGLRAMTVQELTAYRDEHYVPNNVVFSAAGPVKHEDFAALIEKKFGHMKAANVTSLPAPTYKGDTAFIEDEQAELCAMMLGAETVPATDPDFHAYEVLGSILGGGASSRFYKEIVDNRGLAGGIEAGQLSFRNSGTFVISTDIAPEKSKELIAAIYSEIRKLTNDLTEAELDKARAGIEMAVLSGIETNRGACSSYGRSTLTLGKPEIAADVLARFQKLTVGDIKRVAGNILAQNPTVAMVVPKGTNPVHLPDHNEVLSMRNGKSGPSTSAGNDNTAPKPQQP